MQLTAVNNLAAAWTLVNQGKPMNSGMNFICQCRFSELVSSRQIKVLYSLVGYSYTGVSYVTLGIFLFTSTQLCQRHFSTGSITSGSLGPGAQTLITPTVSLCCFGFLSQGSKSNFSLQILLLQSQLDISNTWEPQGLNDAQGNSNSLCQPNCQLLLTLIVELDAQRHSWLFIPSQRLHCLHRHNKQLVSEWSEVPLR